MVGSMVEKINTSRWTATSFRIDARQRVNEMRSLLDASVREIAGEARQAYGQKVAAQIEAMAAGTTPKGTNELQEILQKNPKEFGRVKDQEAVGCLLVAVERRIERFRSLREYEEYSAKAERAELLKGSAREMETSKLQAERDYVNSNLTAREQRLPAARGGPGDTRTVSAMRTPERMVSEGHSNEVASYTAMIKSGASPREALREIANARSKPLLQSTLDEHQARPAVRETVKQIENERTAQTRSRVDRDLSRGR